MSTPSHAGAAAPRESRNPVVPAQAGILPNSHLMAPPLHPRGAAHHGPPLTNMIPRLSPCLPQMPVQPHANTAHDSLSLLLIAARPVRAV
jgi:hypothetical protein